LEESGLSQFLATAATTPADVLAVEPLEAELEAVVSQLLARGDAEDLESAVGRLARLMAGKFGRHLEAKAPQTFERWVGYVDRLATATEGAADATIERLLRSFGGKPQVVVDFLVSLPAEASVTQTELQQKVGIEPSYLSRVVRRLTEADLVVQWRDGRNRRLRVTGMGRRWKSHTAEVAAAASISTVIPIPDVEIVITRNTSAGERALALCGSGGRPAGLWDPAA